MKSLTKLEVSSILSVTILSATTLCGFAFSNVNNTTAQNIPVQTVVITGKRLTTEEKLAWDNQKMQTVVITAKRLTTEEKLAMDTEQTQQLASKTVKINATL